MISGRNFFLFILCFCFSNRVLASLSSWEKLESHRDLPQLLSIYDSLLYQGNNSPILYAKKNLVLAKLAIEKSEFQKAHQYLDKSIEYLSKNSKDSVWNTLLIKVYSQKCHLLYDTGNDIDTVLSTALKVYTSANIHFSDANIYSQLCSDIAGMYGIKGDHEQSIFFYKKAASISKGKNENLGLIYNNLAFAYDEIGHTHHVIENYVKAQKIWSELVPQNIRNNSIVLQNLISSYIAYGDLKSAKRYLLTYENYFKTVVNPQRKSLDLLNDNDSIIQASFDFIKAHIDYYGNVYLKDSAEKYIYLMEGLYANSPTYQNKYARYVFSSIESYGLVHKKMGNYVEADKWIKKTKKYISGDFYSMKYYANLGVMYYDVKKYAASIEMINKALTFFPDNTNSLSFYMLSTLKSELLVLLSKEKEGVQLLKQVFTQMLQKDRLIEDLSLLKYEDFHPLNSSRHISLLIKSGKIYEHLHQRSKDPKHLKTAHNFYRVAAEMFHQYYLKSFYNQDLDNITKQINDGLLRTYRESKVELAEIINLIENNASQHLWKKFIDRKSEESKNFLEKNTSCSSFNHFDFDLKQLQATLLPGQVIVKYLVGEESVYAIKIEPQDLQLHCLGKVEELKKKVSNIFIQLQNFTFPKNKSVQQYEMFSKQLLQPLNLQHAEQLTFVLDDFLNAFPMEAIIDIHQSQLKSINYSYSLSLLSIQKKMHHPAKNRTLAVFAPEYGGTQNKQEEKRNFQFKNLVFAQKEAQSIVKSTKGDVYIGPQSTKQNFISQSSKYNLLHLAMHSVVDTQNYELSYLVFQNQEPLFYQELYQMNIPAQLVILSACNTGKGMLEQGEGMMSLSRAFTYAGVSSTIHSLWEVPDKETYDLMQLFYEQLVEGLNPGEALLNAKRLFIEKYPLKKHPYYWSGFVLHGDVDMSMEQRAMYGWWAVFGLVVLLSGWMFYRKRKHSETYSS